MFDLGFQELLLILLIILILFGGKKLPELSRSIGEAMRELRKGFKDEPVALKDTKSKGEKKS